MCHFCGWDYQQTDFPFFFFISLAKKNTQHAQSSLWKVLVKCASSIKILSFFCNTSTTKYFEAFYSYTKYKSTMSSTLYSENPDRFEVP